MGRVFCDQVGKCRDHFQFRRRKANVIGETLMGTNCHLSANSGLPAIVVPRGSPAGASSETRRGERDGPSLTTSAWLILSGADLESKYSPRRS
jgi:hypothetical protein